MPWWLWMLFGLVLLILEVGLAGGFYLAFFGIGALCVGFLVAIGLAAADWLQWLLFSVLSVVTLAFFRRPIMMRLAPPAAIGSTAWSAKPLPPARISRAAGSAKRSCAVRRGPRATAARSRSRRIRAVASSVSTG